MTAKTLEKEAWEKLEEVLDPELHISIVDLGLIYKIEDKSGDIHIDMTLTTIGCPLFGVIEKEMESKLKEVEEIKSVDINLVFDPPWDMERMSERGKALMGI